MSNSSAQNNSTSLPDLSKSEISIKLVREEYERADCFCGEVQSFRNAAGIPAINELRNAGKHLMDALDDDGNIKSEGDLHSALGHARRAAYEAYEAGSLTALGIIIKFKEDFSSIVISEVIPRYPDILQQAQLAQRSLEEGRAKDFDREQDHTQRMHAFRQLREACDYLDANRDEANKKLDSARRSSRNGMIAIAMAILGILFGAPSFVDWLQRQYTSVTVGSPAVAQPTPSAAPTEQPTVS